MLFLSSLTTALLFFVLSTSPVELSSSIEFPVDCSLFSAFRRVEVRDVQVDKRVTMTKQPKRQAKRIEKNESTEIKDLALTWNSTEEAMELSKIEKEEARITAYDDISYGTGKESNQQR